MCDVIHVFMIHGGFVRKNHQTYTLDCEFCYRAFRNKQLYNLSIEGVYTSVSTSLFSFSFLLSLTIFLLC